MAFDPQPFRVLLLRRLWLPLLPTARNCPCGLPLDSCGTTEQLVLQQGGGPCFAVESVVKRGPGCLWTCVCRTWTWPVLMPWTIAVWISWLTASPSSRAQLAVDTTLVSDATGFLTVGPRTTRVPCWTQLDVAKNGLTRSLRASSVAPVCLSLQAKFRAGGQRKAVISSVSWRKRKRKRGENPAICGPEHAKLGGTGGRRSWLAVLRKLLPCRSWNTEEVQEWMVSLRQPQR